MTFGERNPRSQSGEARPNGFDLGATAAEDRRSPKRWRADSGSDSRGSVLECASSLALGLALEIGTVSDSSAAPAGSATHRPFHETPNGATGTVALPSSGPPRRASFQPPIFQLWQRWLTAMSNPTAPCNFDAGIR